MDRFGGHSFCFYSLVIPCFNLCTAHLLDIQRRMLSRLGMKIYAAEAMGHLILNWGLFGLGGDNRALFE